MIVLNKHNYSHVAHTHLIILKWDDTVHISMYMYM